MNNFIKIDNRFKSAETQFAKSIGDAVSHDLTYVAAFHGPEHHYAKAVRLESGRVMVVSANDVCGEFVVLDEVPDFDQSAYDEVGSFASLCNAAGISQPSKLPLNDARLRMMMSGED